MKIYSLTNLFGCIFIVAATFNVLRLLIRIRFAVIRLLPRILAGRGWWRRGRTARWHRAGSRLGSRRSRFRTLLHGSRRALSSDTRFRWRRDRCPGAHARLWRWLHGGWCHHRLTGVHRQLLCRSPHCRDARLGCRPRPGKSRHLARVNNRLLARVPRRQHLAELPAREVIRQLHQ